MNAIRLQSQIGSWLRLSGYAVHMGVFAMFLFDMSGLEERGALLFSFTSYMLLIGAGLVLHVLAAAVPHMRFSGVEYPEYA